MKTFQLFDHVIEMKDYPHVRGVHETAEKLHEMLEAHNIPHAFTLPHPETIKESSETVLALNFNGEDRMAVSLIYALYGKLHRGADDEVIARALVRVAGKCL